MWWAATELDSTVLDAQAETLKNFLDPSVSLTPHIQSVIRSCGAVPSKYNQPPSLLLLWPKSPLSLTWVIIITP